MTPPDLDAVLRELARPVANPPREPSVWTLLRHGRSDVERWETGRKYASRLHRIRRHVGRECRCCHQRFSPQGSYDVTCDQCKRAKRRCCNSCGEVFIRAFPQEQRCPKCRKETQ